MHVPIGNPRVVTGHRMDTSCLTNRQPQAKVGKLIDNIMDRVDYHTITSCQICRRSRYSQVYMGQTLLH